MAIKFHSETAFREGHVCVQLFGGHAFSRPLPPWRSVQWLNCCCRAALLFVFSAFFAAPIHCADDPASLLKQNFESAKSALAAGDLPGAEREFKQTIALGLRQLGSQIDHRDVGGRHTDSHTIELALQLRQHLADGARRAGGCRDHRQRRRARPAQVLVRQVEDALIVGVSVHRGHQATLDAEALMQDLSDRRQAVGGARGV